MSWAAEEFAELDPGDKRLNTDTWMWARAQVAEAAPLESARWVEGYQRVAEQAAALPTTRLVDVAHREGDMLELRECAATLGHPADGLVRSRHDRKLPDGTKRWASVARGEPLETIRFTQPARPG